MLIHFGYWKDPHVEINHKIFYGLKLVQSVCFMCPLVGVCRLVWWAPGSQHDRLVVSWVLAVELITASVFSSHEARGPVTPSDIIADIHQVHAELYQGLPFCYMVTVIQD